MYVLVDRSLEDALLREGATVVARYPAFVLARADAAPAGLPAGSAEVLSDPAITVHGTRVEIPEGTFDLGDAPHTLVRFAGPVAPEWKDALAARGAEVLFWAPRFGACLRLPEGMDAAALREAFPFVVGALPYTEELCSRGLEEQTAAVRQRTGLPGDLYDLVCFSREDRARVETELGAMGIPVLGSSSSKVRVHFAGDPAVLRDLVGVKLVDPARAPVLLHGVAAPAAPGLAAALGLAGPDGAWRADLTGRGQTVAVADTGLDRGAPDDTLHPDFRGRVRALRSWPVNPSWAPFVVHPGSDDGPADRNSGHGTHVAGLAVGSGGASGGEHRGAAPEAGLVFQSIEQHTRIRPEYLSRMPSGFYLSGRPLDLRQLFREAREQGARIHVNSWGDPARGRYTDDCYEADLFLRESPDAVVLFAAGNDGADRDGNRTADEGTLYAPASAKNVVAVGATEGPHTGVGMRGTWGDCDASGKRYAAAPDRADAVSGDAAQLALFSSAGPTADGRIKPDLCAPGTNLAAPRSAACGASGWGLASPLPHYMYNGGTSMANGVAGGFVALVRQAWEAHLGAAPSGPALKALLVLGALPVLRRDGRGEEPRHAAGFGRLHFAGCAPKQPGRTARLEDHAAAGGLASGEVREFPFTVARPGPLRAVLAWYDAPGETLVNDLDLCLVAPGGRRVWGNHPRGADAAPDRRNTVEAVHLPEAAPGEYTLRVVAANVPAGTQGFALALTHPAPAGFPIPVDALLGIGERTARRLADAGAPTLDRLAGMSDREITERTGLRGRPLAAVRERLGVVEAAAARPAPRLPREVTLAQIGRPGSGAPAGVAPEDWRQAVAELSPLAAVLNRDRLPRIRLADLFGAA